MSDPTLVARDALRGVSVGISVSDSADLARLGLSRSHCDFAVAELALAILNAGGSIVYGGRLVPTGFTQVLLDEVGRFASRDRALTICLAASVHESMSRKKLRRIRDGVHNSADIVCLTEQGTEVAIEERDRSVTANAATALTNMREYITAASDVRVIVGGKLTGQQGRMPGVLQEARMSIDAGKPLYVAGGFGGAAAAVAQVLGYDDGSWAPPHYPRDRDQADDALRRLGAAARSGLAPDGLEDLSRRQLAVTPRPSDIASLVVHGIASR